MGLLGGLITIPINAYFAYILKHEEQQYQHRLDMVAKKQELLLQHRLEMERKIKDDELTKLREIVLRLEQEMKK